MAKPRVVFDTNVFVRALINPRGINARLLESRRRFVLITSPAIIEEVTEVLARIDLLGQRPFGKWMPSASSRFFGAHDGSIRM